jgi:NTP pyrophosphatase (non-canonical NTP hydrolase)
MKDLNELRDRAYKTACEHGFHEEELSDKHCLMLVITELSEAIEADRKGKKIDIKQFECGISYPKNDFKQVYEYCIKGSVEEELADAAIRLLDLAGLRNIEVQRIETMEAAYVSLFKSMPFPECIYDIVMNITKCERTIRPCVNLSLAIIFALAESRDIDLLWHINEKMKYNELRSNKHGKKY